MEITLFLINQIVKCGIPDCQQTIVLNNNYVCDASDFRCQYCFKQGKYIQTKKISKSNDDGLKESSKTSTQIKCVNPIPNNNIPTKSNIPVTIRTSIRCEYKESDFQTILACNVSWEEYYIPFRCCFNYIGYWSINGFDEYKATVDSLLHIPMHRKTKVFYYQIRQNNEPWIFIIKRMDGLFVYFASTCDNSRTKNVGIGRISYAKSWDVFWTECLDTNSRNLLIPICINT